MKEDAQREEARQRAERILKVRSGVMSAAEAARELGVSRKTYYKWEKRALSAMLEGLCERNSGRPALPRDGEKERLRETVTEMEKDRVRMKERETIRELLRVEGEKKAGESGHGG